MSFRIATTPLAGDVQEPAQRAGGLSAELLAAIIPTAGLDAVLARLRRPDVLVVTTGQQPALLTGPLYTIHKALSAAALARHLELRWKRPVVPMFWVAGDDHDWEEARSASWTDAEGALRTASLRERAPDAPMAPLWREPLGIEVGDVLESLRRTLPASPFRDGALEWMERHNGPDRSVAAAAGGALAELLAPYGVVCLDSTSPPVKRAAAPLLLRALALSEGLEADLLARSGALAADGVDSGIAIGSGTTLVMLDGPQGRDRLVRAGGGYVTRRTRERISAEELSAIAERAPERLSANVLLRPVLESALFPTVAYCAGPSELRYLSLAEPVFAGLQVHRTRALPRWSGVIVEAHVDRALEKFGLTLTELMDPAADLLARAVRASLPASAAEALAGLRADLEGRYATLRAEAMRIDPTLGRTFELALRRSLDAVQRADRKLVRNLKRRHQTELAQLVRARDAVLPAGKPQERVVTAASVLARHGAAALDAVLAEADRWYAAALEGRPVPA